MSKIALAGVGILAVLSIVAFVLVRGFKSNQSLPVGTDQGVAVSPTPTRGSSELVILEEVVVTGGEFSFSPATVNLKKDKMVRLRFENVGKVPHNFMVPDLGISTAVIPGGREVIVEVTPKTTGTFEFYCSVGNHKAQGMVGKVIVE